MEVKNVEYAIIGSGTAGLGAYSRIKRQTDSFVMIQYGPYGTTCARVGCMPSKMLINAADHAHDMLHAGQFGVHAKPTINGEQVFARIQEDRDEKFVGNVLKTINAIPPQFKLEGMAKFHSNQQIQVDEHTLVEAEKVIIACGTRPLIPDVFAPVKDDILNHIQQSPLVKGDRLFFEGFVSAEDPRGIYFVSPVSEADLVEIANLRIFS